MLDYSTDTDIRTQRISKTTGNLGRYRVLRSYRMKLTNIATVTAVFIGIMLTTDALSDTVFIKSGYYDYHGYGGYSHYYRPSPGYFPYHHYNYAPRLYHRKHYDRQHYWNNHYYKHHRYAEKRHRYFRDRHSYGHHHRYHWGYSHR